MTSIVDILKELNEKYQCEPEIKGNLILEEHRGFMAKSISDKEERPYYDSINADEKNIKYISEWNYLYN